MAVGMKRNSNLGIPEILVYKTKAERVPVYQEFVGEVYGKKDISIRARVAGYLEQIYFNEGTQVEKGKLALQNRKPII